jgi:DNA-binding beta-propeller fold protein YncE
MPLCEIFTELDGMSVETQIWSIKTIAGSGEPGLTGDGGPAIRACLNEPKALTLDVHGDVLIADSENHVVRKLDRRSGIITTVAGCSGLSSLQLKAVDSGDVAVSGDDPFSEGSGSAERAFAQQTDLSGTVRYVVNSAGVSKRFGGDGGPAVSALLNFPTAVAVDSGGHLYIADTMNHRIRRVEPGTGRIMTIAGVGQPRFGGDGGTALCAGLNEPAALAVQGGLLYLADQSNNRVRAIDLASGIISTIVGTGTASYNGDGMLAVEASLAGPSGLAIGSDGTLYIADTFNGRVRALDLASGSIRTVVGDGGEYRFQGPTEAPSASLSRPSGIAVDPQGNLFITDSDNHLVRRWDRITGRLDRLAGVGVANYGGDGGMALEASLSYPFGIVIDANGHLVVADTFNHRIREIMLA